MGARARRAEPPSALIDMIYRELRVIAGAVVRSGKRRSDSLQPTDLVHAAYVKLVDPARVTLNDRLHFFALAAKVMRQILVDHARRGAAMKRGGNAARVTMSVSLMRAATVELDVLDLHDALRDLASLDERQSHVVELRYFAGLEVAETAEVLGLSTATVEREWRAARAWLRSRLTRTPGRDS
jgi:RNA polymerase sigma factor (TIGR02999 family)